MESKKKKTLDWYRHNYFNWYLKNKKNPMKMGQYVFRQDEFKLDGISPLLSDNVNMDGDPFGYPEIAPVNRGNGGVINNGNGGDGGDGGAPVNRGNGNIIIIGDRANQNNNGVNFFRLNDEQQRQVNEDMQEDNLQIPQIQNQATFQQLQTLYDNSQKFINTVRRLNPNNFNPRAIQNINQLIQQHQQRIQTLQQRMDNHPQSPTNIRRRNRNQNQFNQLQQLTQQLQQVQNQIRNINNFDTRRLSDNGKQALWRKRTEHRTLQRNLQLQIRNLQQNQQGNQPQNNNNNNNNNMNIDNDNTPERQHIRLQLQNQNPLFNHVIQVNQQNIELFRDHIYQNWNNFSRENNYPIEGFGQNPQNTITYLDGVRRRVIGMLRSEQAHNRRPRKFNYINTMMNAIDYEIQRMNNLPN